MKKKVLIFIDWYVPGYKAGGPVRSVSNMVAHLKNEFDFSIVTSDTDYCETEPYNNVISDQWNILADGTRVFYFSKETLSRKSVESILSTEEYDIVYLNGIFSKAFTIWPLLSLRKRKDKKIIVAARGMFADSALNVKKFKKKLFLFAVKLSRFFYNVIFHVTNENEREDVERVLGNRMHIMVAGNLPGIEVESAKPPLSKSSGELRLINFARIAPEKNLLYALTILRRIKGNVIFDFYGPVYNEEYWNKCQQIIKELPPNIKANYKGSLEPENVSGILNDYHFMFMPTRGENFGHIILQSLCAAVPVIISDQTPWKELKSKKSGWAVPLEMDDVLVKVIDHCLEMDQELYTKISQSAFSYGMEYTSDQNTLARNRQLFQL
ncbi:MAG: glycosyltransferase family 4 protein [Bacteroidota bacterium]|nr:glycosyltransferase family 4 protein [Bacteroidota bacterium]